MTPLVSVFVASLVGSVHCVGMCGGLLGFAVAPNRPPAAAEPAALGERAPAGRSLGALRAQAIYHGTRLLGYVALGAAAGQLGAGLDSAGESLGIRRVAALLSAAAMLAFGLLSLLRRGNGLVPLRRGPRGRPWQRTLGQLERALSSVMRRAQQRSPARRAALIGLATAVLPCGWLYAFVLAAAGSGSHLAGAEVMIAFWLGTLPALFGAGAVLRLFASHLARRAPRVGALVIALLGLVNLAARWPSEASAGAAPPPCHAEP